MEGQLTPKERKKLYSWICEAKPQLVLEIGTWKGGGSTWQIANAIKDSSYDARFITCEIDKDFHKQAKAIYNKPEFYFVHCILMSCTDVIKSLSDIPPDFVFYDGPNDAEFTFETFKLLDNIMQPGSKFACHDWDEFKHDGGVVAEKGKILRPYLEKSKQWVCLEYVTKPNSVGMALYEKLK